MGATAQAGKPQKKAKRPDTPCHRVMKGSTDPKGSRKNVPACECACKGDEEAQHITPQDQHVDIMCPECSGTYKGKRQRKWWCPQDGRMHDKAPDRNGLRAPD